MKIKTLFIPILMCVGSFLLISCGDDAAKEKKAADEVNDAKEASDKAYQAYLGEVDKYREESSARIAANKQAITDYNLSVQASKKKMSEDQARRIADLEARNERMQKKLDEYKAEDQTKWQSFKQEFGRDMDELGQAFKDLTVNNVK